MLVCFLTFVLMIIIYVVVKNRKKSQVRTILAVEIGNVKESAEWTVAELNYSPKFYKFLVTQSDAIRLLETYFSMQLIWADGLTMLNSAMNIPVPLQDRIMVKIWQVPKIRRIMNSNYYAVLKVFVLKGELLEVIVLKPLIQITSAEGRQSAIYPQISA